MCEAALAEKISNIDNSTFETMYKQFCVKYKNRRNQIWFQIFYTETETLFKQVHPQQAQP